jgi:hypothetical protein
MSHEFEIVPADDRPQRPRGLGHAPSPIALALERGDTVFIPGVLTSSAASGGQQGRNSYLRHRGFVVTTRRGTRNGVKGTYVWAERNGHEGDTP